MFNWATKITKKMVFVWAISCTAILMVIFGTISIVLVTIPVTYGTAIDYDKVFYVEYRNENNRALYGKDEKQLYTTSGDLHTVPIRDLLDLLEKSGKSNRLANLFRGNPTEKVENNNTDNLYTSTFTTNFSTNALVISFTEPQYGISPTDSRTVFKLTDPDTSGDLVYSIYIPLDRVSDTFCEQTWYLVTTSTSKTSGGSPQSISKKITTYGNYYKLGKYVQELLVRY